MRPKLPVGISTFSTIRTEGYVYVDKTALIRQLVEQGRYYFLSRPRRFGKSLLVDTLKELFEGNENLFQGLAIHPHWIWDKKHPVIHITFNDGVYTDRETLDQGIRIQLLDNARRLQVELPQVTENTLLFQRLLENVVARYGQQVVVLIDEYDKPIMDQILDREKIIQLREGLKSFYSLLKGRDRLIRFVLLTGVSKFSQVSLFSGLNNLEDITIKAQYSSLCGYTQIELEQYFVDYLEGIDKEKVRQWYNGYHWLGETVYNPFDVLLFLKDRLYRSYWFSTATPTFLMKLLKEGRYYLPEMECFAVQESSLGSFDIDDMSAEILLFQTGYLTIRKTIQMGNQLGFELGYPNLEVKLSLNTHLLDYLTPLHSRASRVSLQVWRLLVDAQLDELCNLFKRFFSSIPHDWYRNNQIDQYEGYYASLFYSQMVACGATTLPEDVTSFGRIDLTVIADSNVFVFEFKVIEGDQGDGSALEQIKARSYADKYRDGRELYLVGIEFSQQQRNIVGFNWEKL